MEFENRINQATLLKKEIDSYRPFGERILTQIREYFRIALTYSSNALEGNTLTETETKILLEDGLTVGGKPLRDYLEAIGHSQAYDYVLSLAHQERPITQDIIKQLHRLFYFRIDASNAGIYRQQPVFIAGADVEFPSPSQVPYAMEEFIHEMSSKVGRAGNLHPIEYAAQLHIRFVNIHPFIDGNGRTARLLMNLALLQHGYGITVIPPIVRREYMVAIKAGNGGDYVPFTNFLSNMVGESEKDYLRILKTLTTY